MRNRRACLQIIPSILKSTVVIMFLGLSACPTPIDETMLNQLKDFTGPTISIATPAERSSYAAMVFVSGVVRDSAGNGDGKIKNLEYEIIPATIQGGQVTFDENGAFSFDFPTVDVDGSILVVLRAEDWNGNLAETTLTLLDDGAVPSFLATPANQMVSLSWGTVPFSSSYSVFNLRYGEQADDVSSSYNWNGLTNGTLYSFQLKSFSSQGDDNVSEILDVIPLSSSTLAPWVRQEYQRIRIGWRSISGDDEYVIQRSTQRSGTYAIRGITSATEFVDANVNVGQNYYYRIHPYSQDMIKSGVNGAAPGEMPPERWSIIGNWITPGTPRQVAVAGDYAYVADYLDGIQVIDISDPTYPIVNTYDTPGWGMSVAVEGTRLYVGDGSQGVQVLDISSPPSISFLSSYDTVGAARDVEFYGNYAVVADDSGGVVVLDLSAFPTITEAANSPVNTAGTAFDIAISGDYAYVADDNDLQVIDLSDPTFPIVGSWFGYFYAVGIEIVGNYAYLAEGAQGLHVIDISAAPYSPNHTVDTDGTAVGVAVSGSKAYVADSSGGLIIIDISTPESAVIVGDRPTVDLATKVTIAGERAFVCDSDAGVQVIDVSEPTYPIVGSYDTPGLAYGVFVADGYAYVSDGNNKIFRAVDISDPTNPTYERGVFVDTAALNGIVSGDFAYIADVGSGLYIVDISTTAPSPFTVLGSVDTPGQMQEVAVSGDYAFIADYNAGLQVADVSDPGNPVLISSVATTGRTEAIKIVGNTAYLAAETDGLVAIDISDPDNPVILGTAATPFDGRDVVISGDVAFIADATNFVTYFRVIDISDSNYPQIGIAAETGQAWGIDVWGEYLYVADAADGLMVFDVSDPAAPLFLGSRSTGGIPDDVAVSGGHAYMAARDAGLIVIDLFELD